MLQEYKAWANMPGVNKTVILEVYEVPVMYTYLEIINFDWHEDQAIQGLHPSCLAVRFGDLDNNEGAVSMYRFIWLLVPSEDPSNSLHKACD